MTCSEMKTLKRGMCLHRRRGLKVDLFAIAIAIVWRIKKYIHLMPSLMGSEGVINMDTLKLNNCAIPDE